MTAIALGTFVIPIHAEEHVWLFELKLFGGTVLLIAVARALFMHYRSRAAVGELSSRGEA